jgi:hypothetical protein
MGTAFGIIDAFTDPPGNNRRAYLFTSIFSRSFFQAKAYIFIFT